MRFLLLLLFSAELYADPNIGDICVFNNEDIIKAVKVIRIAMYDPGHYVVKEIGKTKYPVAEAIYLTKCTPEAKKDQQN